MKILVFHLPYASKDILFGDGNLANLQYLMSIGTYGFLDQPESNFPNWMVLAHNDSDNEVLTMWEYLTEAEKHCLFVGNLPKDVTGKIINSSNTQSKITKLEGEGADNFSIFQYLLNEQDWDYGYFTASLSNDNYMEKEKYIHFDQKMGEILESLSDETLIMLVAQLHEDEHSVYFVFVTINNPIVGEKESENAFDLAPTVLELAGYPLPKNTIGKSWVAGLDLGQDAGSGLTEDEEAILRERLSGLGYL